jgi:hypothetical protein
MEQEIEIDEQRRLEALRLALNSFYSPVSEVDIVGRAKAFLDFLRGDLCDADGGIIGTSQDKDKPND